jgi:hypothetical protein
MLRCIASAVRDQFMRAVEQQFGLLGHAFLVRVLPKSMAHRGPADEQSQAASQPYWRASFGAPMFGFDHVTWRPSIANPRRRLSHLTGRLREDRGCL